MTTTNTALTEQQVDTLWRAAVGEESLRFLADMCERWFDAEGATQAAYGETIRSYVKSSQLAARVGL